MDVPLSPIGGDEQARADNVLHGPSVAKTHDAAVDEDQGAAVAVRGLSPPDLSTRPRSSSTSPRCPPLAALIVYSFSYFLAFGMVIIPAPMVFNQIVNGAPHSVSSTASLAFGMWGVVNMAAQFCMARAWGEISDAVGRKPCLLCSALGTSVLHFALATSPTLWPLFVAICLEGATSTAYSASQAYIADVSKDKALGSNFGLFFGLAVGGGIALGVPLSAVVISAANDNPRVSFVVSGAICIVGGLGAWLCVPESLPPQRRRHMRLRDANPLGAFRMTWRNPYITGICLAYMCMSLARGGTQAIFVNYVSLRFGWSNLFLAVFFVVVGGGMAVYPRFLIPRFGEERCLVLGNVLSALSACVIAVDSTGYIAAALQVVLMAGDVVYPASLALLAKQVPGTEQGAIQGTADSIRTVCSGAGGYFVAAVFSFFIASAPSSTPHTRTGDTDAGPPYIPGAGFFAIALMHCAALAFVLATRWKFGRFAVRGTRG